ncbi:hypothetical protein [Actinoplanes sp. NPDC049118]|uniref:hypothetical protein n=1 Tax=Actinoplanes sp. NPDC049118 TaxID=3155769 RepID=UPI0033FDD247
MNAAETTPSGAGGAGVSVRLGPTTTSDSVALLPSNQEIFVGCEVKGRTCSHRRPLRRQNGGMKVRKSPVLCGGRR